MQSVPANFNDESAPYRALVAAAMSLWVDDLIKTNGKGMRDWTANRMPQRWRLFCGLLGLDPWRCVEGVWHRIGERRDLIASTTPEQTAEALAKRIRASKLRMLRTRRGRLARAPWYAEYREARSLGFRAIEAIDLAKQEVRQ